MARVRRCREQWVELVNELESSGLTAAEFSRQHKLTLSSVYRWRSILRGDIEASRAKKPVTFVELVASPPAPAPSAAWVEVGDSVVLRFASQPDPGYLATLARALAD